MAENRYKGNSSAYGFGRFIDGMEDMNNTRKNSLHNPIVAAQGSSVSSGIPSSPTVNQLPMGQNANEQYVNNTVGGQRSKYGIPTSMNNAIDLRNQSVKGGVDGGYDFYQQGINRQGSGGDIYSKFDASNWDMDSQAGVDMTNNFGSNLPQLEVGKTLSSNPAGTEKPWYGSLPSGEGSGYDPSKPKPMPYDPNSNQRMMDTQVAQHKGRKIAKERDAAGRKIHGEGSYYSAGQPEKLYDQDRRDSEARQVDMLSGGTNMQDATNIDATGFQDHPSNDPYQPKWGKEKVDLDRFASYDSGKRFSNEQVAENLAMETSQRRQGIKEAITDEYGLPTEGSSTMSFDRGMALQAKKGPDYSGKSGMVSMDSMKDELSSLWDQDIDPSSIGEDIAGGLTPNSVVDSTSKLGEGKTLGSTLGKAGDAIGKAAPYIAAGANILSTVSQMDQRSDIIDNLGDSVGRVEGMIGGMANQDYAEEKAMSDEYSEGNRRIGEMGNLALGDRLDAAKGSNLNTGSIKRIKEDLIQDAHRSTDVSLAEAADAYETKRDQYVSDSRETRAKAGEELKQLREELKEQERQQAMAPYSLAADLAIGVVGAANPLLGMGLSAMKNKAMS